MNDYEKYVANSVDVIIIGGGHAGCEAALSCARRGLKTIMFTINLDSVAMMPCNPNIGGSSKGHLVKEIDALGGEMGKNIDKTFIQSRMLNTGKGPAVYSLRAQADKRKYSLEMKRILEETDNLIIKQNEIVDIIFENNSVKGVMSDSGAIYYCKAAVLTTGTYLNARCLYGETISYNGPNGLKASTKLSQCLKNHGVTLYRFKTGTPARVDGKTVDYSKMEVQNGDAKIVPFSFENTSQEIERTQIPCYLTYTNEQTHKIIRDNINRSPMYSGVIEGTGTRYCPSIEDKIVRFADKERHQVFVEPEGEDTTEVYIQGMSTSLPEDVQIAMYRSIKGLENCEFTRAGYAIEYDCIDATELKLSLEFKNLSGLFSAGQFNGSSGYEEAAAQGLLAGINAGQFVLEKEAIILDRSEGYIGVLIDDLVTKGTKEPYRMMTSRAEYRLLLRQDNADLRLSEIGYKVGLISKTRFQSLQTKIQQIENEVQRCRNLVLSPNNVNEILEKYESTPIISGAKLSDLIKRPELDYYKLESADLTREKLSDEICEQVNISLKYEGYIARQMQQVEQFKKLEKRAIPENINYGEIKSLRLEATQKLTAIRPENIGHASRITGVSPADISVLMVYLERFR